MLFSGTFKISLLFEGQEVSKALPLFQREMSTMPQGIWQKVVFESKSREDRGFQVKFNNIFFIC